jgi:FkbM family methyltransferase
MSSHLPSAAPSRSPFWIPTFVNNLRTPAVRVLKGLANRLDGIADKMSGLGEAYGLNIETQTASQFLNNSESIFFDVGANVGAYTRSLLSNPTISSNLKELHLFEPSAKTFAILRNKIIDSRARCVNKGCSDSTRTVKLHSNTVASGLSSLYRRRLDHFGIAMDQSEEVQVIRLDEYAKEWGIEYIDFLKFDVEGHELACFHGAESLFEEQKIGALQFEFGGCNIDSRTYFQDFFYFFQRHGYSVFRLTAKGSLFRIDRYSEDLEYFSTTNYFALSGERMLQIPK